MAQHVTQQMPQQHDCEEVMRCVCCCCS